MTESETSLFRESLGGHLLPKVLAVVGLGSVGYGGYMHFTMGDRTLGNCLETNVCNPWHPQWVIAPLVIGVISIFLAVYLFSNR